MTKYNLLFATNSFISVFDDADDAAAKTAADAQAKADADAKAAADAASAGNGKDGNKTYTQDELNSIISRERKQYEDKTKTTITQLEELKKSKSLSDTDKTKLTQRIESLQDELLTKEQLAAKEREKIQKQHDEEKTRIVDERDTWQLRYRSSEINRAITDAATAADAFDSSQIAALLIPNATLQEEMDNEGKGLGSFIPKVKFQDVDKDGKKVTLDLTIQDAVKRMKDSPEKYGNLFKSTANGGVGMQGGGKSRTEADMKNMNPTEWRKFRKQTGLANAGK